MAKKNSRLQRLRDGIQALLDEGVFRSERELSGLYKFLHFWMLIARSFNRNRCPIRAAALSYTTLLALIPMLAVAISVTSSLLKKEGEQQIYQFVDKVIAGIMPPAVLHPNAPVRTAFVTADGASGLDQTNAPSASTNLASAQTAPAASGTTVAADESASIRTNTAASADGDTPTTLAQQEAARRIHEFVQKTQSSAIAGFGMLALVYVAIQMLSQVEGTFNDIWGVTRGRNWLLRIVLYWTTITLGPLLLAGALGLASGPHWQTTQRLITKAPGIGHFIFPLLTLVVIWLTFAMLYLLVPNTRVRISAALVGGFVGGSLWQLNNMFGFLYVSRVVTNSKIYGSLGLVPVFMAGLYLSWLILLFGAQVAYAFQNRTLYFQEKIAENVNQRGREFVALRLMTSIGQRFQHGLPPATIQEMSAELAIPSQLAQQVLHTLVAAHLVSEISGTEPAYTPARPLDAINAHHLLQAMRATPGQELITRDEPVRQEVYGEFARIQEAEKQAAASLTMLALVQRAQARLEISPPPEAGKTTQLTPALVPTIEPDNERNRPS